MRRTNLKIAIVEAGWNHQGLATRANLSLPGQPMSEHTITEFITCRKNPTKAQAAALAAVLGKSERKLFMRRDGAQALKEAV